MDTRRLNSFVKIVDLGSVTRAAAVLRIAQPALSQQVANLEAEFRAQLLIRSPKGVIPTPAGLVLYRYARSILRQIEDAQRCVRDASEHLSGSVSLGLAPWSSISRIAPALLRELRIRHPGILLHICDIFSVTMSELMLRGRMDLAVLYGDAPPRGLHYKTVGHEHFHLVGRQEVLAEAGVEDMASGAQIARLPLILPTEESFLRQMVERACADAGGTTQVVAEVYSSDLLAATLCDGLGASVLPHAAAAALKGSEQLRIVPIGPTPLTMPISICIPDSTGLSDTAFAVHDLVAEMVAAALADELALGAEQAQAGPARDTLSRREPKATRARSAGTGSE